jgi:hypothetical protein
MRSSHVVLDQVEIAFHDPRAVAHAGLLLPATLAERLGMEQATDQLVDLGERPGAARPGRKLRFPASYGAWCGSRSCDGTSCQGVLHLHAVLGPRPADHHGP